MRADSMVGLQFNVSTSVSILRRLLPFCLSVHNNTSPASFYRYSVYPTQQVPPSKTTHKSHSYFKSHDHGEEQNQSKTRDIQPYRVPRTRKSSACQSTKVIWILYLRATFGVVLVICNG
jgi:hypothetical protein